jgi:hypothetical protein
LSCSHTNRGQREIFTRFIAKLQLLNDEFAGNSGTCSHQ